jgi:tetratricopeptide (TPR) repeat protein
MKPILFSILFLQFVSIALAQTYVKELETLNGICVKKSDKKPFSGRYVDYYNNRKIKEIGEYREGIPEGIRITYHINGQTEWEGLYVKGKEEGPWRRYYENGNLRTVVVYEHGVRSGSYYEFSPEGKLITQYFYKEGRAGYDDHFTYLLQNGYRLMKENEYRFAIAMFAQAIKINPTVSELYFFRGFCESYNFQFKKAIDDFNKAIVLKPNYPEAYANRGKAKIFLLTIGGNPNVDPEKATDACSDFKKAIAQGDKSKDTADMIARYCKESVKQ